MNGHVKVLPSPVPEKFNTFNKFKSPACSRSSPSPVEPGRVPAKWVAGRGVRDLVRDGDKGTPGLEHFVVNDHAVRDVGVVSVDVEVVELGCRVGGTTFQAA